MADAPTTPHPGSRLSNVEWGLLIGAAIAIDLTQLALDALVIGFALNWLIDLLVTMSLWLIYHLKGVKMNGSKFAVLGVGFILDGLGLGAAPLWGVDVFGVFLLDKADKKLAALAQKTEPQEGRIVGSIRPNQRAAQTSDQRGQNKKVA